MNGYLFLQSVCVLHLLLSYLLILFFLSILFLQYIIIFSNSQCSLRFSGILPLTLPLSFHYSLNLSVGMEMQSFKIVYILVLKGILFWPYSWNISLAGINLSVGSYWFQHRRQDNFSIFWLQLLLLGSQVSVRLLLCEATLFCYFGYLKGYHFIFYDLKFYYNVSGYKFPYSYTAWDFLLVLVLLGY